MFDNLRIGTSLGRGYDRPDSNGHSTSDGKVDDGRDAHSEYLRFAGKDYQPNHESHTHAFRAFRPHRGDRP